MMRGAVSMSTPLARKLEASLLRDADGRTAVLRRWADEEAAHQRVLADLNREIAEKRASLRRVQSELGVMLGLSETVKSVAEIQRMVAAHFGVNVKDMLSASHARVFSWPRQIAVYLTRSTTMHPLSMIGRLFGGRDHSTIHHSVRAVERRMETDKSTSDMVEMLRLRIIDDDACQERMTQRFLACE